MRRLLVCCGALAALAACGSPQQASNQQTLPLAPSSTDSASPLPPASPTTTPVVEATRCTAASLTGEIQSSDAGAGNRYAKFVVTNSGAAPCTLNGYSGFQLLDANGRPLPTNLQRTQNPGPTPITLVPGGNAVANLHWTVVPTGNEPVDKPCQPEAASAAAIPPDETEPMTVTWGLGPVCGGGKIEISAFYPA